MSDNCPLLLMEDDRVWETKPLRFFNAWFSNSKCLKIMEEARSVNVDERWAAFRIIKKLIVGGSFKSPGKDGAWRLAGCLSYEGFLVGSGVLLFCIIIYGLIWIR